MMFLDQVDLKKEYSDKKCVQDTTDSKDSDSRTAPHIDESITKSATNTSVDSRSLLNAHSRLGTKVKIEGTHPASEQLLESTFPPVDTSTSDIISGSNESDQPRAKRTLRSGSRLLGKKYNRNAKEDPKKPDLSYVAIITKAIEQSPQRRLILSEIYKYFEDNYAYFRSASNGWKNSIRHNLSISKEFTRVPRDVSFKSKIKGSYWVISKDLLMSGSDSSWKDSKVSDFIQFHSLEESDYHSPSRSDKSRCQNLSGNPRRNNRMKNIVPQRVANSQKSRKGRKAKSLPKIRDFDSKPTSRLILPMPTTDSSFYFESIKDEYGPIKSHFSTIPYGDSISRYAPGYIASESVDQYRDLQKLAPSKHSRLPEIILPPLFSRAEMTRMPDDCKITQKSCDVPILTPLKDVWMQSVCLTSPKVIPTSSPYESLSNGYTESYINQSIDPFNKGAPQRRQMYEYRPMFASSNMEMDQDGTSPAFDILL